MNFLKKIPCLIPIGLLSLAFSLQAAELVLDEKIRANELSLRWHVSGKDAFLPDSVRLVAKDKTGKDIQPGKKPEILLDNDKNFSKCINFLIDTSLTMKPWLKQPVAAVIGHIVDILPKYHQTALDTFDSTLETFVDFTTDTAKIKLATGQLNADGRITELFRLTQEAILKLEPCKGARKTLLIFSDGISEDQNFTDQHVIQTAKEKGVEIFAFGINKNKLQLQSLKILTSQTNGTFWDLTSNTDPRVIAADFNRVLNTSGSMRVTLPPDTTEVTLTLSAGKQNLTKTFRVTVNNPPQNSLKDYAVYSALGLGSALVLIFIVYRRRKNKSVEPPSPIAFLVGDAETLPVTKFRCRIGTLPDNDLVVDNSYVSRYHAVLEYKNDTFVLSDLNSKNGTFVNNGETPITTATVIDGDRVRFADITFTFTLTNQNNRIP